MAVQLPPDAAMITQAAVEGVTIMKLADIMKAEKFSGDEK